MHYNNESEMRFPYSSRLLFDGFVTRMAASLANGEHNLLRISVESFGHCSCNRQYARMDNASFNRPTNYLFFFPPYRSSCVPFVKREQRWVSDYFVRGVLLTRSISSIEKYVQRICKFR